MKKIISIVLTALILLSSLSLFASCGIDEAVEEQSTQAETERPTEMKEIEVDFGGARFINDYYIYESEDLKGLYSAHALDAVRKMEKEGADEGTFKVNGATYTVKLAGKDFCEITDQSGARVSFAYKSEIMSFSEAFDPNGDPDLKFETLRAFSNGERSFEYGSENYGIVYNEDDASVTFKGEEIAVISSLRVVIKYEGQNVWHEFYEKVREAISELTESGDIHKEVEFEIENVNTGEVKKYTVSYDAQRDFYSIKTNVTLEVYKMD